MSEAKDGGGGFFMSKRDTSDAKERSGGDDYDSKSSKQVEHDMEEEDVLPDEARPPRRASVGWGNEGAASGAGGEDKQGDASTASGGSTMETKRGGRRRKGGDAASSAGEPKAAKNRHFDEDRDSTDIVEIPDLEEEEREADITMQVAEAPRNTTRAVQSLKELDRDIKFSLPSSAALGVDLSLLTSVLCPEKAVIESDDSWNFESLLNEVSQEMQKDLDEKEEMIKAEGA